MSRIFRSRLDPSGLLAHVNLLRARQDLVSLRKQAYDVDCMAFALCAASAHMSQCESSSHGALTHSGLYQVAQALPILPDVIASLERGAGQEARPPEPRVPSPGPCSVESITAEACGGRLFAPVPWNLKDQPLEHWASTAGVQCGPSLLPMMDASARAMLVSALTEPAVKVAPATAIADELDTYASMCLKSRVCVWRVVMRARSVIAALFCRRCYVFDCRLHGAAIAAPRVSIVCR